MQISQGQRIPLSKLIQGQFLSLTIQIHSPHTVDLACFGLDAAGKLSDDRYMIFFNQPGSPCGSLKQAGTTFSLNLAGLPAFIDRLVFTAAIDGAGAMREILPSSFVVKDAIGQAVATCPFTGNTFSGEKAIMVADIYRKDGHWRLASNLQGFNDGLAALVKHFGGEVSSDDAIPAAPTPVQTTLSLEKKVETAAPQLVSLAKKAQVSLEKAKLTHVKARVALILDASGSMNFQYTQGRVQEVVNRVLPLAIHFDDDGSIDCWAFAAKPQKLSAITLANYSNFIQTDNHGWRSWDVGSRSNDEPKVMEQVISYYLDSGDRSPVYILFISDGGVHENGKITRLMTDAAKLPLYWQFVGLGGRDYGILEKLDDMRGRVVDNCGFFALDDLHQVSEEQLYDQLMEEFPDWIKAASAKGIIG